MNLKETEDQNLGGFQIRHRSMQDSFDFSMEEITARYSEFLQRQEEKSDSVSSEDQEHFSNQKDGQKEPESNIFQDDTEEKEVVHAYTQSTTTNKHSDTVGSIQAKDRAVKTGKGDSSIDEWLNGIIEKNEIVKHQEEIIHDNISRQFNDSNYWRNAVMDETHSKKLDDLLSEVNL